MKNGMNGLIRHGLLSLCFVVWATSAFAQRDAIDLSQAIVHNSPVDVASWAVTRRISTITMSPEGSGQAGLHFDDASHAGWPDYTPPGWDGPIQYTVWAGVNMGGVWHIAGVIQMWRDRGSTGAPILHVVPSCQVNGATVFNNNNFACNWVYDGRWGSMTGYNPSAGEGMIFFLTAGNARGVGTVSSVRERTNAVMVNMPANDSGVFSFQAGQPTSGDFDGDLKVDPTVYRPGTGVWFMLRSTTGYTIPGSLAVPWGAPGDIPVPADYDGDGLTDIAVYRPSNGYWFVKTATSAWAAQWGMAGDIPIPEDFDGEGKADLVVYRPSNGYWVVRFSSGSWWQAQWGAPGDIPIPADGDGDGKADLVVYRPSNGTWYAKASSLGYTGWGSTQWGSPGDIPLSADFDGDNKSDIVVYRPSNGGWYILPSSTGFAYGTGRFYQFAGPADMPLPSDFDGDGKADLAVWRPSTGQWFVRFSSTGFTTGATWALGVGSDAPVPTPHGVALSQLTVTGVAASQPSGTAHPGTPITWAANVVGGAAPYTYKFYIFDGNSWSLGQDWTSSNVWTWTPSVAGTYFVQVWVRNSGSGAPYDAYAGSAPYGVLP